MRKLQPSADCVGEGPRCLGWGRTVPGRFCRGDIRAALPPVTELSLVSQEPESDTAVVQALVNRCLSSAESSPHGSHGGTGTACLRLC